MPNHLNKIRNKLAHQAQSAWQLIDTKLHPFPEHLGPVFKKHYDAIEASQWKTPAELKKLQEEKLARLVEHAYAKVPYYKRIFDERGLKPKDIRTQKDLAKLPFLTKQDIRDNYEDLITIGAEKEFWIESHTSGSTGKPLTFLLDPDSNLRELAYTMRAWTFGSYKLGDPVIVLRSYVPKPGQPLHNHQRRNNFHYLSAYHLTPEVMHDYVKIINKSGAKVLRGYPSSLYIFCKFLLEEGIKLPNIDTTITSSEMLLPHYRETISKAIGHPVLDWYGCNERIVTISQCPHSTAYHTNVEYGMLEVVNDKGEVIEEGTGAVVGTALDNLVMPLIRYRPDDLVTIQKAQTCSCGRGLPLEVTQIEGRSDEILAFGDIMLPPINFYTMFHGIPGIVQFQMIQDNEKALQVKLVTNKEFTSEARESMITGLTDRIGKQVTLEIEEVKEIARDAKTGKVKCIVNNTKRK
jgi:phenylacetate-CoA ligase